MSNNPNENSSLSPNGSETNSDQNQPVQPSDGNQSAFSQIPQYERETIELRIQSPESEKQGRKPKRRKRRLRKEIRLALGLLICCVCAGLLFYLLFQMPSSSGHNSSLNTGSGTNHETGDQNAQSDPSYTVLIDPGHGGFDGGNVSDDGLYIEKDINLSVALKVRDELKRINPNANVILTHENDDVNWAIDEMSDLIGRTDLQKSSKADFFVSLHCNAFIGDDSVDGYTIFINSYDPFMKAFAHNLDEDFQKENWSELDAITEDYSLHVVSMGSIPSALVELGYMTNPDDMAGLVNEEVQNNIARAIAEAINTTYIENKSSLQDAKKVYQEKQAEKDTQIEQLRPEHLKQNPAENTQTDQQPAENTPESNPENPSDQPESSEGSDENPEGESAPAE